MNKTDVLAGESELGIVVYLVSAGERTRDGGMLLDDCVRAFGWERTQEAISKGLMIRGRRFPKLETCELSPAGRDMASAVGQRIANRVRDGVRETCSGIPPRALGLLVKEVITDSGSYRARMEPALAQDLQKGGPYQLSCAEETIDAVKRHHCLLTFTEYRSWAAQILKGLVTLGTGMQVRSYRGTDGGTIRYVEYCLTPDTDDHLRSMAAERRKNEELPYDLERAHEMYHQLWVPMHMVGDRRIQLPESSTDEARNIITDAVRLGLVVAKGAPDSFHITNHAAYQEFLAERCLRPFMTYLSTAALYAG